MPGRVTEEQTSSPQQQEVQPRAPFHSQEQVPEHTLTGTTGQTNIERWNGAAHGAEAHEQARQVLQPKEGERLVRALYDFKPATRDEMALKQSEHCRC